MTSNIVVDLQLTNDNDVVLVNNDISLIYNIDVVKQQVRQALRTIKHEWFLDTERGISYGTDWFQSSTTDKARQREIWQILTSIDNVQGLDGLKITRVGRTLEVTGTVISKFGHTGRNIG